MNIQLCQFLKNIWYNFYDDCVRNVDTKTRYEIGITMLVVAIILFVLSTDGKSKTNMINHWFLFWISAIVLILSIVYMSI